MTEAEILAIQGGAVKRFLQYLDNNTTVTALCSADDEKAIQEYLKQFKG